MNFILSNTLSGLNEVEPIFQGETSECGLACVAMLLQSLGESVSITELREKYGASSLGASLLELTHILAQYGVDTDHVQLDIDYLSQLPLPAIVHVKGNHYVIVLKRIGEVYKIIDPATGAQLLHQNILGGGMSGYALLLADGVRPKTKKLSDKKSKASKEKLVELAGGKKLIIMSLLTGGLAFLIPLFIAHTIDRFLGVDGVSAYWSATTFAFVLALLGTFFFDRYCGRTMQRLCASSAMLQVNQGFKKLIDNNLSFFLRRTPGQITARFTAFGGASIEKISLYNTVVMSSFVSFFAFLVMLFLQPWLASVTIASIAISAILANLYMVEAQNLRIAGEQARAENQQFLLETIQGVTSWKTSLATGRRVIMYSDHVLKMVRNWEGHADLSLRQRTSYSILNSMELVILLYLAANSIFTKELSITEFYAFFFLRQIALSFAVSGFAAWIPIKSNNVAITRARDVFEGPKDNFKISAFLSFNDSIDVKGLHCGYQRNISVIKGIDLRIKSGEKIAILGASGSGKTTLIRNLAGFDFSTTGVLKIDGVTYEDWSTLRGYSYLSTASDVIFSGTVIQNITMFSERPDKLRCKTIIEDLGLCACVSALPSGLDTILTDATSWLSAGERQRLLVARAVYANRSLSIYDEPTANLDMHSAEKVLKLILASKSACLVVTHDVNNLDLFDTVYHLQGGVLGPYFKTISR